ncbi:PAS domain-containing sensor histidine kinase [Loktanella sp. DJP18]|uniref:PAS domain-containing sensor histidine kinase n=1 Tax=Loktanella sp. DJP18 TaxID=3409788 RepID=UPI003BB7F5FF
MLDDDRAQRDAILLNRMILRSIVDHAVITLDMDCKVTSWNEGAESILGWTEEEAIGQSGDLFFTPEDVARDRPEVEMRTALREGRADDERWHMRKDGSRFWASGLMMPLLTDGDATEPATDGTNINGFVKIFRDRTFQEKARRRIALLEQRSTLAMKRAGTVGIIEFDALDDSVVADSVAAELHGIPGQDADTALPTSRFFGCIHPDDLPLVQSALEASVRDGDDFDIVYRTLSHAPQPNWVHAQATIDSDAAKRITKLSGIIVDITDQRAAAHMQDMQLSFLDDVRDMMQPDDIVSLALQTIAKTLHVSRVGHGHIEATDVINIKADWNVEGGTSLVGRQHYSTFGNMFHTLKDGETVLIADTQDDAQIDDPSVLAGIQVRSLVCLPLMELGRLRAVLFVNDIGPRHWSEAECRFMRAIFDRTYAAIDRLRFETERNLMAAELTHRMKNMLTMAQVVVTQTLRGTNDIAIARSAITARLRALSEAQDVLTRVDNRDAAISEVVASALKPHLGAGDRITISGPYVVLNAQQVLGLALGLHELATNALKYGALSNEAGHVDIWWTFNEGTFSFLWSEIGGPPVSAPVAGGFGSRILNQVVGGYFEGTTEVTYDAQGIRFVLTGTC